VFCYLPIRLRAMAAGRLTFHQLPVHQLV
jgi:hypothetical protein